MKICYLILVHNKFDQAARMIGRLAGPHVSFVLHIDKNVAADAVEAFQARLYSFGKVAYARRERARWGSYQQALAIMRCVEAAVDEHPGFDRCVLLSGQDYPIASHERVCQFFEAHREAEFIESFALDLSYVSGPGWTPYYRFRRYHVWFGNRRFVVPGLRKGMPAIPLYHGSTWWALSSGAMHYLASEFRTNHVMRHYLEAGFLVDEVYVPTLMMNSPFASQVTGHNTTYFEFTGTSGPHPKTFVAADFDTLSRSAKLFARKFDAGVDAEILDLLDSSAAAESDRNEAPQG